MFQKVKTTRFTKVTNFSLIGVAVLALIYAGFRIEEYRSTSRKIDHLKERQKALNQLNRDANLLKDRKDVEKRLKSKSLSMIDRKVLVAAGIKDTRFIKYASKIKNSKNASVKVQMTPDLKKNMDAIKAYATTMRADLISRSYWAKKEFKTIHSNILATIKDNPLNLVRWRDNVEDIKALRDKVKATRIKNNFKKNLLKRFGRVITLSEKIVKNISDQRVASNGINFILIKANDLRAELPTRLATNSAKLDSAYKTLYGNIIGDIAKLGVFLIAFASIVFFRMRRNHRRELAKQESDSAELTNHAEEVLAQLNILQNDTVVATAILDETEKVIWSNNRFNELFNIVPNGRTLSWNKLLRNDVFDYSKETGVFGAVKLRADLNKDYILKSRTSKYRGMEKRIVQIWPVEEYYLELAGKNNILTVPAESVPPQYSELGNLMEELLVKMGVFFDNFKVNVELGNKLPTLTTVNAEHLILSLANVLKGMIFYLNYSKQGSTINISYNKVNSKLLFKIEAVDARIELSTIDTELRFNNKSYHSLGYYLTEGEQFLDKYNASVNVRNFLAPNGESSIAVVELELDEHETKQKRSGKYRNLQFNKSDSKMEIEGLI